jgi:hypothetical protein
MEGLARLGIRRRHAAFGQRDQALDERAQLLGLGHRRLDALVPQERCRLVAQQGDTVLGDASELSVSNVVSHNA